ncbi:MAG: right-handed parallel beta-helix repeat-containing protein [Candidatus Pacearchaeota archaeon]|nr:right-handed parallel beta-helix repeat-containing protein [Candidatus Pacearchaeota archaeon]
MRKVCLFILMALVMFAFILSVNYSKADCIGTTKNFSCAKGPVNITESCYLNESTKISGHSCFKIYGSMVKDIVVDCKGYTIQGNDTSDTYAFGIFGQRVLVKNCVIEDFDKGIYSEGKQFIGIFNNTANSSNYGFYFNGTNNNNVTGNIAYNNEVGFYAQDSNNLDFYFNKAYNNSQKGIYLSNTNNTNIYHNNVSSNFMYGLYLEESHNNKIFNLTANNNEMQKGIELLRSSNNTINQSITNNNGGDGIVMYSGNYNVIVNTITNSNRGSQGIYLYGSSHNIIDNVTANYNSDNGIYISQSQSENNTIKNSYFENNYRGIYIADGAHGNRIEGNEINEGSMGFVLSNSENNTIISNIVYSSSGDGFHIASDSNDNYVANNIAHDNIGQGFIVRDSSNNAIFNNTAYNNNNGFSLSGWSGSNSGNNFTNNIAHHNQQNGFYFILSTVTNTRLENNIAYNNSVSGEPSAGFVIYSVRDVTMINNSAQGNLGGIALTYAENCTLINNKMDNNQYNFVLWGNIDAQHNHNIDTSNTVEGKPIYYIKNATNAIYDSTNAAVFYCIWCDNVTIKDLAITRQGFGVYFWKTNNSRAENVNGTYTYNLIRLASSSNNTFNNVKMGANYAYDFRSTIGFSNWTFISDLGAWNNSFNDFNFNGVLVDFVASNIAMRKTGSIAVPSGYKTINKNIEAEDLDVSNDEPYLFMNISYSDSDIEGMQESSLFITRHNGTLELNPSVFSNPYGVNTAQNYVYANITDFGSSFGIVGEEIEEREGGVGRVYVERCGNGKCGKGENAGNCPQDCKEEAKEAEKEAEEKKEGEVEKEVEEAREEQQPAIPAYQKYVPYLIAFVVLVAAGAIIWYLLHLRRMHYLGYR